MPRQTLLTAVVLQFDNPVQPPQWGAPALMSTVSIIADDAGTALYQPTHLSQPAVSEDFTPEILETINLQLSKLGLELTRKE